MYKLFSQRKREEEQGVSDVYLYDNFGKGFRNQFLHIISDIFTGNNGGEAYYLLKGQINFWEISCKLFAREKGLKYIYSGFGDANNRNAFEYYVDQCSNTDFLDLLDFIFSKIIANKQTEKIVGKEKIEYGIEELNYRFMQHSLGYEFIDGKLIVKTNEVIHQNIIKPTLYLLNNKKFRGAEQEYLQAFDFYKQGKNKDAILNAIKSFESVLKTICSEMNYTYDKDKDTAKQLLQHLTDNNFYPKYLESHLNGIRTTLESGAPTVRNKNAGHGQGQDIVVVSQNYAEYALNLVATNILFLVKVFNEQKGQSK